jgi:hypothetical protein
MKGKAQVTSRHDITARSEHSFYVASQVDKHISLSHERCFEMNAL